MLAVVGGASDCVAGFTLAVEAVGAVAAAVAGAAMVVAVVVVPPLAAAGSGTEPEKLVSIENSVTTAVWRTLAAEATGSAACGGVMSPGATAKAELAQHLHDGCTATFSVVTGMGAAAPFVAAHTWVCGPQMHAQPSGDGHGLACLGQQPLSRTPQHVCVVSLSGVQPCPLREQQHVSMADKLYRKQFCGRGGVHTPTGRCDTEYCNDTHVQGSMHNKSTTAVKND